MCTLKLLYVKNTSSFQIIFTEFFVWFPSFECLLKLGTFVQRIIFHSFITRAICCRVEGKPSSHLLQRWPGHECKTMPLSTARWHFCFCKHRSNSPPDGLTISCQLLLAALYFGPASTITGKRQSTFIFYLIVPDCSNISDNAKWLSEQAN